MKRALTVALTVIFMLAAIMAVADDNCNSPCPGGATKTSDKVPAAKQSGGCCAKGAKAATATASVISAANEETKEESGEAATISADVKVPAETTEKIAEGGCPDVTGKSALENFHETMHPMHMALEESKYDEIRSLMPAMEKSTEGLKAYKCPTEDKCSPECKKEFNKRKDELLNSVKLLKKACSETDNAKLESAFMTVHENYIRFAGYCNMKPQGEESKPEGK